MRRFEERGGAKDGLRGANGNKHNDYVFLREKEIIET